ncbi:MAG: S-layer protein [Methanosarcinales archaeon]|nr:S-layer protein [Methanosarcinales archaeon]
MVMLGTAQAVVPDFTSTSPNQSTSSTFSESQTFNASTNIIVNFTWYVDRILMPKTDNNTTYSDYSNNTTPVGAYNVTVIAANGSDTKSYKWDWTVTAKPGPNLSNPVPAQTFSSEIGKTQIFSINVDQAINVTWFINGTVEEPVASKNAGKLQYTNNSPVIGNNYNVIVFVENSYGNDSYKWTWSVVPTPIIFTKFVPSKEPYPSNLIGESRTFSVDLNQACKVVWSINDDNNVQMNGTNSTPVTSASFTTSKSSTGTFTVKATATNTTSKATNTTSWTWTVNPAEFYSGNRIWDEKQNLSREYTWDAWSFGGFYYDLDSDEGGETLTITDIDWSLGKNDVVYTAKPIPVKFERSTFGEYYVIGFMAERYFAGYKSGSIGDSNDNLMDEDKLSKVLVDDDKSQMLRAGNVLTLEEGYEFRILELDVQGNQALVGLFKDDSKVEEDILEGGDTLVYKVDDIPIIGIHINSVFAGMETSSIRIDGIFQISDEFTSVNNGEKFGLMTIDSVDSNEIVMKNENSISLSKHKGESFNLMGKINIEVGDDKPLRFAPVVDTSEPGTYELRGTVTEKEDPEWTPLNFEGLLYDMDTGFGKESLSIEREDTDDTSIDSGDLKYTTKPISVNFEHKEDGWESYQAIGFMGEKYFAGYTRSSTFISSDRSLIGEERLGKILIDEDKKYTLRLGNPLTLQEGYSLRIEDISRDGDLVMIGVYQDGDAITTDILGTDETFVYDVEVGGTDIPIIIAHIKNVFTGFETSSVFIDGLFQISEDFISVKNGDSYGKMEVIDVNDDEITLENDAKFSLSKGETIDIMGDVKIKVADNSSTVRFYPFLEVIVEEPEYMELEIPDSVFQNEEITMTVTSDGDEIEDVTITFGDIEIGSTDSNGELTYTPTETGTITVNASKSGYESVSEVIEVLHQPKTIEISAPLVIDKGEEISISITSEGVGIGGASVKFGNIDLGTTPSNGNITYIPEEPGTFTISVSKSGYQDASQDIDVTDPAAKLVFTNLTIEPRLVQPGQMVNITAEAANFGTIRDSDTAILKINNEVIETQELLLDRGETVKLSYSVNRSKPGTYRVELNDRTGTFKVAGEGSITGLVFGIIALFAAIAIIYSIYTGTLTTEVIAAKVEAIKIQLKQLFER